MSNLILFGGRYAVERCRQWHDVIWVFGDNLIGVGKGGQAIIRDEPNAVGIPTKAAPSMDADAFFNDWNTKHWLGLIKQVQYVEELLAQGREVILPVTNENRISLGCGLANLPYYAPGMYHFLETWFDKMRKEYA